MEAKFNEKVEELKVKEAFSFHAQITVGKWFIKCEEVVKLANCLIHILSLRLKGAFEEMTYENTPPTIFNLILLCRYMVKDLREELAHMKKV